MWMLNSSEKTELQSSIEMLFTKMIILIQFMFFYLYVIYNCGQVFVKILIILRITTSFLEYLDFLKTYSF